MSHLTFLEQVGWKELCICIYVQVELVNLESIVNAWVKEYIPSYLVKGQTKFILLVKSQNKYLAGPSNVWQRTKISTHDI